MTAELNLGWLDGTILACYVIMLAAIGWWAAHRTVKTTEDYVLAKVPVTLSVVRSPRFLMPCVRSIRIVCVN